jgi:hypothetical protein
MPECLIWLTVFFRASGALAVFVIVKNIESAIRTLGLVVSSFLISRTSQDKALLLVGILDAFLDSKGLVTLKKWRGCFVIDVVPLLRHNSFHGLPTKFCNQSAGCKLWACQYYKAAKWVMERC